MTDDTPQTADGGTGREATPLTDGGVDETTIDPWGSSTIADYRKLFEEFGIEEFEEILPAVPNPHYLMRRGVIFGHRDYGPVAEALAELLDQPEDDPVHTAFAPTRWFRRDDWHVVAILDGHENFSPGQIRGLGKVTESEQGSESVIDSHLRSGEVDDDSHVVGAAEVDIDGECFWGRNLGWILVRDSLGVDRFDGSHPTVGL